MVTYLTSAAAFLRYILHVVYYQQARPRSTFLSPVPSSSLRSSLVFRLSCKLSRPSYVFGYFTLHSQPTRNTPRRDHTFRAPQKSTYSDGDTDADISIELLFFPLSYRVPGIPICVQMARPAKPVSATSSAAASENNKRIGAGTRRRRRPLTTYGQQNGKAKTKSKSKAGNKRTRPPKPKGRAVVDVQDEKDEDGEWEVARISHIRHAALRTDENEGYEYLVHWAAPGYAPTWTATALIGTVALHQFWIGSDSVVIHTAG
ncbi:hypothetical protein EKO27_g834, partial [Xylaria grammica]